MIKSFNRSIDRASSDYIVMVTDDDPVEPQFLQVMHGLTVAHPGYSIYCGFLRKNKKPEQVEIINAADFIREVLDPSRTSSLLWSSSLMLRDAALKAGKIPDYGSPHLADHAFIVLTGSIGGGVITNRMYSSLTSHQTNFSKAHIDPYLSGCTGFYKTIKDHSEGKQNESEILQAVKKHLSVWFISSIFNLKKFYTVHKPDQAVLSAIESFAGKILEQPFMKHLSPRYSAKQFIFRVKRTLRVLK
jgi:hypothetical protein